jgi:hypothetical protein
MYAAACTIIGDEEYECLLIPAFLRRKAYRVAVDFKLPVSFSATMTLISAIEVHCRFFEICEITCSFRARFVNELEQAKYVCQRFAETMGGCKSNIPQPVILFFDCCNIGLDSYKVCYFSTTNDR